MSDGTFKTRKPKRPASLPWMSGWGIVAGRMSPALAEVTGRLAADLSQQATRDMLAERFGVTPSVEASHRSDHQCTGSIEELANEIATWSTDVEVELRGGDWQISVEDARARLKSA